MLRGREASVDLPTHQLFDLSVDPWEVTDVAAAHPDVVASLRASLTDWMPGPPIHCVLTTTDSPGPPPSAIDVGVGVALSTKTMDGRKLTRKIRFTLRHGCPTARVWTAR